jgi:hypothetical protein
MSADYAFIRIAEDTARGDATMFSFILGERVLACGIMVALIWAPAPALAQQNAAVPDFSSNQTGWVGTGAGGNFTAVPGLLPPVTIDTIGQNDKGFVDNFRTPHTEKLHVVERWKMVDGGQAMVVSFTVEDPDSFYSPWSGMRRYRRVQQAIVEDVCAENNRGLFDYHIPVANKPDF